MVSDFIFDGIQLSDLGYIAIQESNEDLVNVSMMSYETIKGARTDISHRVSHQYEENYSTTFTIMKNMCDEDGDGFLTNDEISEMTRWLARKEYKWFRLIDDNEENNDEIWYQVQIQVQKDYVGANVVGLYLTVNSNAPYGFTREIKLTPAIPTSNINVVSDEEGYIYPTLIITCNAGTNVQITNNTENRVTIINNCSSGEIITIQGGDLLQISSSIEHDFSSDFNYIFPRFVNRFGQYSNSFTVDGDVDIILKYRGIRKVGL